MLPSFHANLKFYVGLDAVKDENTSLSARGKKLVISSRLFRLLKTKRK